MYKAGIPCELEPRQFATYTCGKCGTTVDGENKASHQRTCGSGSFHHSGHTKNLLSCLAKKAELKVPEVLEAFQLEIEKLNAYTIVAQLRDYLPRASWLGSLQS